MGPAEKVTFARDKGLVSRGGGQVCKLNGAFAESERLSDRLRRSFEKYGGIGGHDYS
jgi:hypothetical protein